MISFLVAFGVVDGLSDHNVRVDSGSYRQFRVLYNLFFTMGILASLQAVLTLGIAGIVLSLAMAVDANVLIFERTKEECVLVRA